MNESVFTDTVVCSESEYGSERNEVCGSQSKKWRGMGAIMKESHISAVLMDVAPH